MNLIFRFFEEVFPIFPYLRNRNRTLDKVNDEVELSRQSERYEKLDPDSLSARIQEEHERATKIDEKTFKFTLGLSVSLTVLAAASGSFVKLLPNSSYAIYISIICSIASLYMLVAGIIALGAIKTLATYGYGTDHLLKQKERGNSYLAEALYAQERMNIIRQMRNEAAYQSLRNGFLMLFLALVLFVVMLSNPNRTSKPSETNIEETYTGSDIEDLKKKALISDENVKNKSMQPTSKASAD